MRHIRGGGVSGGKHRLNEKRENVAVPHLQLVMDRSQERKLGMSLLNGLHRTEAKGRAQADK